MVPITTYGGRGQELNVASFVVSFSQQPAYLALPRYDTNAQNTVLMLRFVVSRLLLVQLREQ